MPVLPLEIEMKYQYLVPCLFTVIAILSACGGGSGSNTSGNENSFEYRWDLPDDFPQPKVPDDNSMSVAKVELGRFLFYDRRMSINEARSCGDCHEQRLAFTDGKEVAVGITVNEIHSKNALSLTNVAYNSVFNWANPNFTTLEHQALGVLINDDPIELGWTDKEEVILDRFRHDSQYPELFARAFPDEAKPINMDNVIKAISSFQRIWISGNSAFDRYNRGDKSAMSESAQRGLDLFFGERLECFHCHAGFNFSQTVDHEGVAFTQIEFHNTGLYNIGENHLYPSDGTGLWRITGNEQDMGKFRPPTLRNIALTAPYMHDGSMDTLESVIVDHYARGGRLISDGPNAGDGSKTPYKSGFVLGFQLTEQEKLDLLAFLDSLTDWEFICNPEFSDPFYNIPDHESCN